MNPRQEGRGVVFRSICRWIVRGLCFSVCWAGSLSAADTQTIPTAFPIERYESLWKHSPFTLTSVEETETDQGFGQFFALAGVARIGSDDLVTLLDKRTQERLLISAKLDSRGFQLVSVQSDHDILKVAVKIKKGAEVATLKFDPALLAARASNQPAGPSYTNAPPPQVQSAVPTISTTPATERPPPVTGEVRRRVVIPSQPPQSR